MESLKILYAKFKDGSIREMLDEWKWIYGYGRRYKKEIIYYILIGMIGTVMGLVGSIASKNLIDIVTGFQKSRILPVAVLMVSMSLFGILFRSLNSRISLKINIRIQNDIQADIFDKVLNVNWLDLSGYSCGDLLMRFGGDVSTVAGSAIGWFPNLIINGFRFIASLAVIVYYDATMGLIVLLNAPVMLVSSRFLLGKMRKYNRKVKEAGSRMMAFQQETFSNVDSIKSFDLDTLFATRLRDEQQRYKDVSLEYNKFSILTNAALSVLGVLIQLLAYGWGVYRLWSGMITYGEMTLFLSQGSTVSSTFNALVGIIPSTVDAVTSAGRIMELIKLPPERHLDQEANELEKTLEDGFRVQLKDVFFAYVKEKEVLSSSWLEANPGEIVALVGPSGEGKTTLIRMCLGLIAPDSGEALLADKEGREVPLNASTRQFFSYVPQGRTLFTGTVADNLRMVRPEATEEEIVEALKIACAYEFVEKMPEGIYSQVGQKGQGVSEGQAQRISIARAILRDAPVLLLDEATSALDVATERKVLKNIIQKRPNKTCIVTTHRPSVLGMCERVYRVMDTRVTELSEEEAGRMSMDF